MTSTGASGQRSFAMWRGLVPLRAFEAKPDIILAACGFTLVSSLLLGGGTRGGFLSDAILELCAIPTFLLAVSSLIDVRWHRSGESVPSLRGPQGRERAVIASEAKQPSSVASSSRQSGLLRRFAPRNDDPTRSSQTAQAAVDTRVQWALALCAAIVLLPLIQLVPLPPWLWTRLPSREPIAAVFDLLGRRPWMPISVSPGATWMSFLSMLAPAAVFLATIQLGYRRRRRLSLIVVAFGVVSAFLGLIQVAQGPASPLRFFAVTNDMEAVGFFANRNHFAALLYAVLVFAAAWTADAAFKPESWRESSHHSWRHSRRGAWRDLKGPPPAMIVGLTAGATVLVVVIAGEVMARSRAGLVLTMVALAAAFASALAGRRAAFDAAAGKAAPGQIVLVATAAAVLIVVQFSLYRILDRFTADPLADARIVFAHNTVRAALAFMPFGAGMGSFVPVYALFERPVDILANVYANHAHDDILELWLETGAFGIALFGLFLAFAGTVCVTLWRRPPADTGPLDVALMRGATVVVALLVAHSFVDYPLRTGAMMAVFAFACALLIAPLRSVEEAPRPAQKAGLSRRAAPAAPQAAPPKVMTQHGGRWGEDVEWPQEWRTAGAPDNDSEK